MHPELTSDIDALYLYNISPGSEAWWDEIIVSGVPYMTAAPDSGVIPPGGSSNIEVAFDATNLIGGDYDCNIMILSNDPDESRVFIPVKIHVVGAPEIALSADTLDFGEIRVGESAADTLEIANVGAEPLIISSISSDNIDFESEYDSLTLNPGETRNVLITFSPGQEGMSGGVLTIESNDNMQSSLGVALKGVGYIPAQISITPDTLREVIDSGDDITRAITIGNSGGKTLNFGIMIEGAFLFDTSNSLQSGSGVSAQTMGGKEVFQARKTASDSGATDSTGAASDRMLTSNPSGPSIRGAGVIIRTIPAPRQTLGLTFMNGNLWAVLKTVPLQTVVQIDPADGSIISSFLLKTGMHVGLTNDGRNLWICNFSQGSVIKYSPDGDSLMTWPAPNGSQIRGIAWDGASLWLGGAASGMLYRTDTNGTVLEARAIPTNMVGWAMDMEWVVGHPNGHLWVVDGAYTNDVNQIDVENDPISIVQDFGFPEPQNVPEGIAHDGRNLWLSAAFSSSLFVVDDGIDERCWLSAEVQGGSIPISGEMEIIVKFDATFLSPGDYTAQINIFSNDPDNPEIGIPVFLKVTEKTYCGRVIDTYGEPVSGATVELWDDFPNGVKLDELTSEIDGQFECDSIGTSAFDAYVYRDAYYPTIVEGIEPGQPEFDIVLTPHPTVTPTHDSNLYYCNENDYYGMPILKGAIIDAYDPDGVLCGTWFVSTSGEYGPMAVYGDNPETGEDEGAAPGDILTFFINGLPAFAAPIAVWSGNGGLDEICLSVSEMKVQNIQLREGWNLVSWRMDTRADDIDSVMGPIMDCVEIVLGFDNGGLTYSPDLAQFSTLLTVDHLHGYWIKMICDRILSISGTQVAATTPIELDAGWNLISYLPEQGDSTADALASVLENLTIALGFDEGGMTYDPLLPSFSTLKAMNPGFGYWLKMNMDDILIYPGIGPKFELTQNPSKSALNDSRQEVHVTNVWMSLYSEQLTLDGEIVPEGSIIRAVASDGGIAGAGSIGANGRLSFMAVYGDDPLTSERDGLKSGEVFGLDISGEPTAEELVWTEFGDCIELRNLGGKKAGEAIPEDYYLNQNIPNPFNPVTEIQFGLPRTSNVRLEVFNIAGQVIAILYDGKMEAGHHAIRWDSRAIDGQAASGIYLCRLKADQFVSTKKLLLLK